MMMDISPVAYTKEELNEVVYSIHHLYQLSQEFAATTITKEEITQRIQLLFPNDPTMSAFVFSNIQITTEGKLQWNFHIDSLYESLHHILSFLAPNEPLDHNKPQLHKSNTLPTLLMKGSKSKFVRSRHLPAISSLFPRYSLHTIPNAAHWLHIDQPEHTAMTCSDFINQISSDMNRS